MNCTPCTPIADSSPIILIATTVVTAVLSLADLAINAYVAHKKNHFSSSCCTSRGFNMCGCALDTEDDIEIPNVRTSDGHTIKSSDGL